jgi:uncharacterized OsmC-like protein
MASAVEGAHGRLVVAELNGLDLNAMRSLVRTLQADPSVAEPFNSWSARVRWRSGFKGEALVRNHTFVIDEPADLIGKDEAPNAAELLLGAYGACLVTGLALNATKQGIRLRDFEVVVEGHLDNILAFIGLSDEGHPGFRDVHVKGYIDADAAADVVRALWTETIARSPIGNTLARPVVVQTELVQAVHA